MHRAALAGSLIAADLAAGHGRRYAVVEVDRAAISAGRIAGELCAGDGDRTACHVDDAAIALRGLIAGDRAAGQVDHAAGCSVDYAAVVCCVAGDRAAGQIERAAAGGVDHAAVGRRVVGDKAAIHVHGTAFFVLIVQENRAAGVFAVVAGDGAAVDVQHALAVVQRDGAASALTGDLAAGDGAAENVQRALVEIDAAAAPALGGALDGAAAGAVTEHEPSAVFDLDLAGAVAGVGLAVQAQAEGSAVHHQVAAEGDAVRQIHIGGLVCIGDGASAVPRRIAHACVAGVVAGIDAAAADAVLMGRPVGMEGVIRGDRHNGVRFHLRAAGGLGIPAVKIVARPGRHRQLAVSAVVGDGLGAAACQCAAVGIEGDGALDLRPVGVEGVIRRRGDRGVGLHLRAAGGRGEPAVKVVVGAVGRGQLAVGAVLVDGPGRLARVQRAAGGVKGDGGFLTGADQIQVVRTAVLPCLQPAEIRVVAGDAAAVGLRNMRLVYRQIIQKDGCALAGNAGKVDAELCVAARVYVGSKYNLRVRIAEIEVVLGGIDRVVIDIRSDRAASSIHVAHIYFLCRRKRHQIEAAARFGGGIAGDAAVPVTDVADADIRAAALFGRVAGDRAAVELAASGILAVEAAAVNAAARFGGHVVLDLAAVEMELCAGGGVDTAAVDRLVIRNDAAIDDDRLAR